MQTQAISLLIIDDNNIVLYSLTHLLRNYGYQVTGAIDRPQALALIENGAGPFDFIISDYRLREGDTGIALIQAAREALGVEIPALIVTGDMELSTIQKIEAAGLAILQKPVQADTLDRKIQQLLAATSS